MKKSISVKVLHNVVTSFVLALPINVLTAKTKWVVDTIVARVNGSNILKSDLESQQVGKDGGYATLHELIEDELLLQRAQEKQLIPTRAEVDRQITSFKIQLNMADATDEQFEEHLKQFGLTLKKYREQIGRLISINHTKSIEISEKVLVTSQDIERYFKENPVTVKEKFHLQMATFPEVNLVTYKADLTQGRIAWDDLGFIEKDDIDKKFIRATELAKNQQTEPIKIQDKYVLLKLIDRQDSRLMTLSERYGDIERQLQQEKQQNFVQTLQDDLRQKAFIFYPLGK